MNGTAGSYSNDVVWNWGYEGANNHWFANCQSGWWGSGGGISTTYGIPIWQTGVATAANQGSTVWRNVPDVACTGNEVWVIYDSGLSGSFGGTSCAAPLWAGFAALVNEQAANEGLPSVGFLAPVFYALGQSENYSSAFHDVTSGNSYWADSTTKYAATTGFDLCTGWGTPNGYGTINALVEYAGPIWVNFAGACPGNGSYTNAFCTLASGVSAVSTGATICLVGAHSTPTPITITKALTLRAFFGDVTIGN
jgi:subtilase family serine protease